MAGQGVKPNGKHAGKGRGFHMNVIIYRASNSQDPSKGFDAIDWTCPKCNHRNITMRWYGRDNYLCRYCEEWTDVKGQTVDTHSVNADIETL